MASSNPTTDLQQQHAIPFVRIALLSRRFPFLTASFLLSPTALARPPSRPTALPTRRLGSPWVAQAASAARPSRRLATPQPRSPHTRPRTPTRPPTPLPLLTPDPRSLSRASTSNSRHPRRRSRVSRPASCRIRSRCRSRTLPPRQAMCSPARWRPPSRASTTPSTRTTVRARLVPQQVALRC